MKHLLLLFVLCLSFHVDAHGQRIWKHDPNAKGPFIWTGSGFNALNLQIRGMPGYRNLFGAEVIIVLGKRNITLESIEQGIVYCDKPLPDSVWIKVSYNGYETVEGKIQSSSSYEVYLNKKIAEAPETVPAGGEVGSPQEPR